MFPYIHNNNRREYIEKGKDFINDKDKAYEIAYNKMNITISKN